MQTIIKLWDRPQLAKSFRQYQGKNAIELITDHPEVVLWHVKHHSWVLSEAAKAEMAAKKKVKV